MLAPLTLHDVKDIAVTISALAGTGVSAIVLRYLRRAGRVAKAVAAAPDLLHAHGEKKGQALTADGISYPFRETAG